ncbi:hypothetical protein ACIBF5_08525 [Micromonospora sp. NPDC050417]|uniref:hypothetical protein n=1 Tax=Micromonospora sp. NPDC050417 TaxID=3364280 RepID=UPI0037A7E86A
MKVRALASTMGIGVAAALMLTAVAVPASADPAPANDYRLLAGVGSDTTQDVLNHLGKVVGGGSTIASWDARPPAGATTTIKTKASGPNGDCTQTRPNGSGAGRTALRNAQSSTNATYDCVDFARSSSYPNAVPQTTGLYTYIPFGVDAVTVAVNENSFLPSNITSVQAQRIYQCFDDDIAGEPVVPLLIQSGSGTRQFWLQKMGVAEQDIAAGFYPCLQDLGNTVQEHDGNVLAGHEEYLLPFSVGQWIAQGNAGQTVGGHQIDIVNRRGPSKLLEIDAVVPRNVDGTLNINFPIRRDVYNVVPTADLVTGSLISNTFAGPTSSVCNEDDVIKAYGFGFRTGSSSNLLELPCGSTLLKADS